MKTNAKNYWDYLVEDGRTYQMGNQPHREYLLDLLNKKMVIEILDVGCGTGPIYQMIRDTKNQFGDPRWIFDYKGTDYSAGMIEVCKKEFPEGNWEVEDARKLTEDENSWDCVLLMHCLDHLDDYEAAIAEAARVARRYVLIVLWRPLTLSGENNLNDRNTYGRDDDGQWEDTHLQEYSEEKLLKAFTDNGLEVELKESGAEINKDGRSNTLYLLKKNGDLSITRRE